MATPRNEPLSDAGFQDVIWKDEMNLSELPLSTISDRAPEGLATLDFYVTEADGATVRRVSVIPPGDDQLQKLVEVAYPGLMPDVSATRPARRKKGELAPAMTLPPKAAKLLASVRGLPNGTDDDVLLALIQLTRQRGFDNRRVNFSLYEVVKLLGWDDGAKSYSRLIVSLLRWKAVLLTYHDSWRDNSEKHYVSKTFNMLDEVSIYTSQGRRSTAPGQTQLPFSSFAWSDVIFKSFADGFLKDLNFSVYKGLDSRIAKRMYRFLDKRFGRVNKGRTEPVAVWLDLRDFACGNIGLTGDYAAWKLKQVLAPAIKELEDNEIIIPLPPARRYKEESRGKWQIVFHQNLKRRAMPEKAAPAVPANGLVAAMEQWGVTRATAEAFAAELPAERIALQLDLLAWWQETGRKPAINDPAAWLVKALRGDYAPPKDYESKAERERKRAAAAAKQQRAEETKRRREEAAQREEAARSAADSAKRAHVENYLASLSSDGRAEFERQAIATASGLYRGQMRGTGPLAEASRWLVIEEAVLRVCPLPAPA